MGVHGMDENTFLQTIENSYKEVDNGEFSTLSVLLTPMDLLKSDERFARAKLYQTDNDEVSLDIIHDRFNEKDNKALEVYYDKTFIGYVRKRFDYEYIDNTELVDEFFFYKKKLRDIEMYWNGNEFIVRRESKVAKEKLIKELGVYGLGLCGESFKKFKNDKEFILSAIKEDVAVYNRASEKLKNDKEVVLATVHKTPVMLKKLDKKFKNDKEVVLVALSGYSLVFCHASDELRNDKEFVLTVFTKYSSSHLLRYVSKELRNDKEVVLAAVKGRGGELDWAGKKFQNDRDIVLAAVQKDGLALRHASDELRNDKEVVLTALREDTRALTYASDKLKDDLNIKAIINAR